MGYDTLNIPEGIGLVVISFSERPAKRRRVVARGSRSRQKTRTCRRWSPGNAECAGNSDIFNCKEECLIPCKICKRLAGCRGVDGGKKCTWGADNPTTLIT